MVEAVGELAFVLIRSGCSGRVVTETCVVLLLYDEVETPIE